MASDNMENTERNNIYRHGAGLINTDDKGLSAYKRKKKRFNDLKQTTERLDALESKVDRILGLLDPS